MEKLYCIYNAKKLESPILYEINDFVKNDNKYKFKHPTYSFNENVDLGKSNYYADYGFSMGDSPLEWIYIYTNDRILAEKILEKETESIGAGMGG